MQLNELNQVKLSQTWNYIISMQKQNEWQIRSIDDFHCKMIISMNLYFTNVEKNDFVCTCPLNIYSF